MVQLQILSGKKAGGQFTSSRLPVHAGRDAQSDLALDEPGVWPRHFQIFRDENDLVCQAEANALVSINDSQITRAVLRNGDVISIGALKMRFALTPPVQKSLVAREWLTWFALALLCLGQVAIIYKLVQ